MNHSSFDNRGRYIIQDFTSISPFSSFLPGIAGPMGIPMWVFYVNRGQGITSFGVESKNCPIMEFLPANKAYRNTATNGFRTFIKIKRSKNYQQYQPFSPWSSDDSTRKMFIGMNELELQEENTQVDLQTNVLYFTIPGENFAGLSRTLTIQNRSDEPVKLDILDGMPALIPFGVNDFLLKSLSRTIEAWMEVINLQKDVPFYRVRASIEDKPEVETFQAGHFALSFVSNIQQNQVLKAFVDPNVIFGQNTSFSKPDAFYSQSLLEISTSRQIGCGKTPCAFFVWEGHLQPLEHVTIYSIYGHMNDVITLNQQYQSWLIEEYIHRKREETNQLAYELTDVIDTKTAAPLFDAYCRQTFLDNVLRGGCPILLGKDKKPYHIYSRKHGDPERDYNAFFLAAEYYSQGNGNYRDVNQNRRCDVLFNPEVKAFDIRNFISLIQSDGYNPLVVEGSQFRLPAGERAAVLSLASYSKPLIKILSLPFTPGKLMKSITDHKITLQVPNEEFLNFVIDRSEQHFEATFGEGYWTDHWTYILDLIECYLVVYPEHKFQLLFDEKTVPFYDGAVFVKPRDQKYCLTPQGPRQLNSIWEAPDKASMIKARKSSPHLLRTHQGHGQIYTTDLFSKLVILALIKFTTLDPWGMGIEMEAGKPGWYDAMNGLPALFGSTLPETYELKRLLQFVIHVIQAQDTFNLILPVEVVELLEKTSRLLDTHHRSDDVQRDHTYWDQVSSAREAYREKTRLGFDGDERTIDAKTLEAHLDAFLRKIDTGIQLALDLNHGIPPTYFTYQVEVFEEIQRSDELDSNSPNAIHFRAKHFKPVILPLFLEGPVRALKVASSETAKDLYHKVRDSDLFDRKLKMYKINASLEEQPLHIGRARAFTPGWLENESIWLHMEYKYLLEVLKAGLYERFFEDFRETVIPFLDPDMYKRSPLENSSFLVSSAHPDESIHGAGFVARLSGSTAEFLSIWNILMAGKQPFIFVEGELHLNLVPILPGWLFSEDGKVSFKFLGRCLVIYYNPDRLDTFTGEINPQKYTLHYKNGQKVEVKAKTLGAPLAEDVREGLIDHIEVFFERQD